MTSVDDRDVDGVDGVPVGPGRGSPGPRGDVPTDGSRRTGAGPLTSADYSVAFSPRNVAIGLAIVAGLVALAARRRRHSQPDDGER